MGSASDGCAAIISSITHGGPGRSSGNAESCQDGPVIGRADATKPGWRVKIFREQINPPVKTEEGTISELISVAAPGGRVGSGGVGEEWWKTAVVYQVYPRSFADSGGDGIGDLRGIAHRLDYLAELGVDVLWLSPIYPSPRDDAGYDISDYRGVDPTFGTLEDFDALLAAVHSRGMRLIMDLVVNHTSDEHAWFVESRASRDSPKRDWYWWRREPNNWRSFFSGSAWEPDKATGELYLHLFSRKQPDLNWENVEVREAVYSMMRWWLDRGVDGFRMDVINMISKDPELPDGDPAARLWPTGAEHYMYGPRIHEFLQEMHSEVFGGRPEALLTVGEMPGVTVEQARLYTDPARGELDMVFQFEHVNLDQGASKWDVRPLDLRDLKASFGRWQEGLAETGWNSLYWNNHDQPRVVSRFGDDSPEYRVRAAKMLGTVLHLHRGTPYVYQGEELGMTNVPFAGIEDLRDIESLNHYAEATAAGEPPERVMAELRAMSRDNARTPMQWDGSEHAGFTTGTPWIGVNPNYPEINAEAARADPDSVFHHYRKLIELRHGEPAVAFGDFTMLLPDDEHVYAFTRRHAGTELLVLGNFSGDTVTPEIPDAAAWEGAELVIANAPPQAGLTLGPWEARVYRVHR
jgi:oligo-1,6-glucosidase